MESEEWKSKTRKEWWVKSWTDQRIWTGPVVPTASSLQKCFSTLSWDCCTSPEMGWQKLHASNSIWPLFVLFEKASYDRFTANSTLSHLHQTVPVIPCLKDVEPGGPQITYRTQMPNVHMFCGWPGLWVFGDDQILGYTSRAHEHAFAQSWFSRNVECMESV